MKNQYSTQQLNQNLPEVLKQISQGNLIEITQSGEPFAVILSSSEYQRLTARTSAGLTPHRHAEHGDEPKALRAELGSAPVSSSKSSFWKSLQDFRSSNNLEELETETDVFADVRDRSSGREVNF